MSWWSDLSRGERATFGACFGGWALDPFDYQFYSFVIPTLRKEWSISAGQAGTLATAALLSPAAGGLIAGLLADRIGRVRTLQQTILWFAVFTCLSGSVVGYLSAGMPLGRAIGLFAAPADAVLLVAAVLSPETRGKELA